MSRVVDLLDKLSEALDWFIARLVFIIIVGLVVVATAQVVFRVFFTALSWSEELSRYLLVWGTFFGATLAHKRGYHIALTFAIEAFGSEMKKIFTIIINILSIVFFGFVIFYGTKMIEMQVFQISPALALPMKYVYLCIPFSLVIMIIHSLANISKELTSLTKGEVVQ
ncbi:MAG: TRAP transporter small permease [Peptococcales bacterium]|jgi:TRAP-type C4-dicarboxylate transport system permease small subunit